MPWLNHPSFTPVRDALIKRFRTGSFVFRKAYKVVFICGGANSNRRSQLEAYFQKHLPEVLAFRAEDVWRELTTSEDTASTSGIKPNALELEEQLALLSDMVLIIVESPGTFAELGAFALSEPLRKKLLPLLDRTFKNDESFVNTGPIRWIDNQSTFSPSIYTDFSIVTRAGGEVTERLKKIKRPDRTDTAKLLEDPKLLLLVLCDLVAALGPATIRQIDFCLNRIIGKVPSISLPHLLRMGTATKLITKKVAPWGEPLYFRATTRGQLNSLFTKTSKTPFDLSEERAKVVSVLLRIDKARTALEILK